MTILGMKHPIPFLFDTPFRGTPVNSCTNRQSPCRPHLLATDSYRM